MLWTIDMDDFNGFCNEKFPLAIAVKNTLKDSNHESCKKTAEVIKSDCKFNKITRLIFMLTI